METAPLTSGDEALIETVKGTNELAVDGEFFGGGHIADGYSHDDIRTCVAVAYPMPDHDADEQRVIPPCGTCRELLADYNESMGSSSPSTATTGSLVPSTCSRRGPGDALTGGRRIQRPPGGQ